MSHVSLTYTVSLLLFLACIFLTCQLNDKTGPDTITLKVPDSLKDSAGKYDSILVQAMVIEGSDTVYRRILFHGRYTDATQLENRPLPGLPSDGFAVILYGYRNEAVALETHLSVLKALSVYH